METILRRTKVEVNKNLYIKDPFSSELGILIAKEGMLLIQDLGIEQFTFKKLAGKTGSTEAAIYRYFENKHMFLLYLSAWYWGWMEHNLVFGTATINDLHQKLGVAIRLLVEGPIFKQNEFLDPMQLRDIVINESIKGFLTKTVDSEHELGIFAEVYKFGERVTDIIRAINPNYKFPKILVSTIQQSSLLQSFNALHLPGMTDATLDDQSRYEFFHQLVMNTIKYEQ